MSHLEELGALAQGEGGTLVRGMQGPRVTGERRQQGSTRVGLQGVGLSEVGLLGVGLQGGVQRLQGLHNLWQRGQRALAPIARQWNPTYYKTQP